MTQRSVALQMTTPSVAPASLQDRWTDIFRSDTLVHLCVFGAIITGTLQGWLKDRIAGWGPYLLSDGLFLAALLLWFATLTVYREPLIRAPHRSSLPAALLVLLVLPAVYALVPAAEPLVTLAGLRAWVLFPLAFLVALTTIRSAGQVRAYVGLVLLLCVVTAGYGIWQYWRGPAGALAAPLAQVRHGSTVFYDIQGANLSDFRAFSTFTFPAPFAAMMVFGMLLGAAVLVHAGRPRWQRAAALVLLPLFFVGMSVSGTRAALITLAVGLLVLGMLRRVHAGQLFLTLLLLAALHAATVLTSGRIVRRLLSVADEATLWTYVAAPLHTAAAALGSSGLGQGIGRSGVGVPYFVVQALPREYFFYGDGDVGRAAAEMGLLGLVWLLVLVVGVLPAMLAAARTLVRTDDADLGLGIGALVLSLAVVVLIGSPLSSTPHALVWWFLFGSAVRLAWDREAATAIGAQPVQHSSGSPTRRLSRADS